MRTFLIPRKSFEHYLGQERRQINLTFASPVLNSTQLLEKLSLMHDALTDERDELAAESIVATSLELVFSLTKARVPRFPKRRSDGKMQMIRDILGDNPATPLSLSELASSVDLSPYHVLREFQLHYGMPPHAFRTQLRIWKARDLLLSKMAISEVALLTGFSDHAHLTRTFHKVVGVPPSHYQTAISFKTG